MQHRHGPRLFTGFLILALTASLTGCLGTGTSQPAQPATPPTPIMGATTPPAPKTPPSRPVPPPTSPTPSPKEVARGNLGITGAIDFLAASGNGIGIVQGSTATYFQLDAQGKATELSSITEMEDSPIGGVAVGDLENNGEMRMAVASRKGLYILGANFAPTLTDYDGLYDVAIADLDGDSKTELLLSRLQKYELQRRTGASIEVLAEVNGEEEIRSGEKNQRLTRDYDVTALKQYGKAALIGHRTADDGTIFALLVEWTSTGPNLSHELPVTSPKEAPLYDMTAGETATGPVIVLSHGGNKPYLDIRNAADGIRIEKIDLPGTGDHTIRMGAFTSTTPDQILTIDTQGNYVIYSLQ